MSKKKIVTSRIDNLDTLEAVMTNHFDIATIRGKLTETEEGYLKGEAVVTRTGVLLYSNPDGTIRRELRHPDEVFSADSMESMKMKPITLRHPKKFVSAEDAKSKSIGNIGENIRPDGRYMIAPIMITDAKAIERMKKDGLRELSLGYSAEVVPADGIYFGEPYTHIQRDIRYNHLAVVSRARAGSMASIKLDSADFENLTVEDTDSFEIDPEINDSKKSHSPTKKESQMVHLIIDGIEYEVPAEVKNHVAKLDKAIEDSAGEITKITGERDTVQAKFDEQTTEIEKLKKADNDIDVHSLVAERLAIVDTAKKVLDEDEVKLLDSLKNDEVKVLVIKKKNDGLDLEGKSADYVNARFDAIAETLKEEKKDEKIKDQRRKTETKDNNDDDEKMDQESARKRMIDGMGEAYKKDINK